MNKILMIGLLLAVAGASTDAFAQQTRRRRAVSSKETRIPREALAPVLKQGQVDAGIESAKKALTVVLPQKLVASKDLPEGEHYLAAIQYKRTCLNFREFISNPDLEEVSGIPLKWFATLFNEMLMVLPTVESIDQSRTAGNQNAYLQARAVYEAQTKEILKHFKKVPKISKEQMKEIREANEARRRQEYLEKQKAEQNKPRTEAAAQ